MWLTRFALTRPVITAMFFVALCVFGAISYFQIGRAQNPPGTEFPLVYIAANYPGASPQEMERLGIKPLEDQLNDLDNVEQLTANAQEGEAEVDVQFKLDTNLDLAAIDVQRRVDTARVFMPSDLDPPEVGKAGSTEPVMTLAVSSNSLNGPALADVVTNQLQPVLKEIPNIQQINVRGVQTPEFHVEPIPAQLIATGATLNDVFDAVQQNNALVPGGRIDKPTQETTVSVHAEINNAADLAAIPLAIPGGAEQGLRVGDVAQTSASHVDQRYISRYNGLPRIRIQLLKNIASDEVSETKLIRDQLKTIEPQFPQLTFHEIDAPADYTKKELNGVWQSLLEGIILTAIVMMLFLHAWRNAAVVMIAIPTSILSTFVVMKALGFTFDFMSLMGLSLIIGILVDDSIVVLENITRHRDMGEEPINAAINGRTEIGSAAIAITMVDVIVFLPIAFLSGLVGKYLKEFGLVVVVATLFSLLVSFTLTPLLAGRWSVKKRSQAAPQWMGFLRKWWVNAGLLVLAVLLYVVPEPVGIDYGRVGGTVLIALVLLNTFVQRYDEIALWYRSHVLEFALQHGFLVVFLCATLFLNAMMLAGGGGAAAAMFDVFLVGVLVVGMLVGLFVRALRNEPIRRADTNGQVHEQGGSVIRAAISGLNPVTWVRTILLGCAGMWSNKRITALTFAIPVGLAILMSPLKQISTDFVPNGQTGYISMSLTYPIGTPIGVTSHYVDQLSAGILKIDGIKTVSSTTGYKDTGWSSTDGGNYATINAQTKPERRKDSNKIIEQIRKLAYLVPGGDLQVAGETDSGSGTQIFYAITGPENELDEAARRIVAFLQAEPGSVNVQSSLMNGAPRLNVNVDSAKAEYLGISPGAAATAARIALGGAVATKVRTPTGLTDVRVQFDAATRNDIATLSQVRVRASNGMLVPLGEIATFQWTVAPTKVERLNRERVVNVTGGVLPQYSLGSVTGPLEKKLKEPGFLPPGVHLKAQGDTEYMIETFTNMGIAMLMSAMLVYMLMVILYGSFLEPLIVMASVPMAVVGALMALSIMSSLPFIDSTVQSLNIISMIGVIMLFGLVAKNGILLVDYSNTLCKRGMRVRDAVLQAAATRFRPILMTTFAMVFGMLPLALGFAEGSEWRQAIGTVIIGGLLSSLVLTLVLVPMIYNTWMGWLERLADQRSVVRELEGERKGDVVLAT